MSDPHALTTSSVQSAILEQRADLDLSNWNEEIVGECKALVRLWRSLFEDEPPEALTLPHRWKPDAEDGNL